jgi:hypothetical protein
MNENKMTDADMWIILKLYRHALDNAECWGEVWDYLDKFVLITYGAGALEKIRIQKFNNKPEGE